MFEFVMLLVAVFIGLAISKALGMAGAHGALPDWMQATYDRVNRRPVDHVTGPGDAPDPAARSVPRPGQPLQKGAHMPDDSEPRFSWERAEAEIFGTPDANSNGDGDQAAAADPSGAAGQPSAVPVLVDSPEAQRAERTTLAGLRAGERRPIIPDWARSPDELRAAARWALGLVSHTTLYHLARTPKYGARLTLRAPVGAGRTLRGWLRWLTDLEGEPLRQDAADRKDPETYLKLTRQRDRRVRWRAGLSVFGFLTLAAAAVVLLAVGPPSARLLALAVIVAILGTAGQPQDKPLIERAVIVHQAPKLTSDMVTRALGNLQVPAINQAIARDPKAIGFDAPIARDGGRGWRAEINLPPGVVAGDVIDKRDRLASGLGRPLGCVWPEGRPEIYPGRLSLYVADQDMATVRPAVWPLAKAGTVDLFKPFPFGTDPRGRNVPLELLYTNMLIGSIPGMGKTLCLKVPLLAAALDPRAELWVFELKGTGDLEPAAQVATRYASGADDDTSEQALIALRHLRAACRDRAKTIKGLPRAACPENKVTPQLASRRELGLHPLVVAIDECQELFSHPEYGTEAGELAEKIIKLGRALGVILLLATQRPDAKSLPTGVSANVGTRFCLKVMGQVENDMVLGTSSYRNGIRATMLTTRDKGVGYLVGGADEALIARTYKIDGPTAERICLRARALREQAGTLAGYAAGDTRPAPTGRDTLLADVLSVVPVGEDKVWTETVLERLQGLRPEVYGTWSREQLTAALKAHGIDTNRQVNAKTPDGKDANRRGFWRQDVADALRDTSGEAA